MDKLLRNALIAGILLAGFGIFFHYVIFLPSVERQKAAQIAAEKEQAAKQQAARQLTYSTCMAEASSAYDTQWATACMSVAKENKIGYSRCIRDSSIMTNEFMGKSYCERVYGDSDPSPDCSLPSKRADGVNEYFEAGKRKCMEELKAGI